MWYTFTPELGMWMRRSPWGAVSPFLVRNGSTDRGQVRRPARRATGAARWRSPGLKAPVPMGFGLEVVQSIDDAPGDGGKERRASHHLRAQQPARPVLVVWSMYWGGQGVAPVSRRQPRLGRNP